MNIKETFNKIKAAFDAPVVAAANPLLVPAASTTVIYKTDNGTELSIVQAGATLAVGDMVTIAGALPPEGEYRLEDGTGMTLDATGAITELEPNEPVTVDLATDPAPSVTPVAAPVALTEAQVREAATKFATGTPEERLTNLEIVAKAVMESCFGWQMQDAERKATADAAMAVYNTSLKLSSDKEVELTEKLEKQTTAVKALFDLVEQLCKVPSADPVTVNGNKKEKSDRADNKEKQLEKFAEAMKELREKK